MGFTQGQVTLGSLKRQPQVPWESRPLCWTATPGSLAQEGPGGMLRGGGSSPGPPELGTERARPQAASGQPVPTPCRTSGLGYREVACPSLPCWGGFLPTLIPSRGRAWDSSWDEALPISDSRWGDPSIPPRQIFRKTPSCHAPPSPEGSKKTATCISFCLLLEITVFV